MIGPQRIGPVDLKKEAQRLLAKYEELTRLHADGCGCVNCGQKRGWKIKVEQNDRRKP